MSKRRLQYAPISCIIEERGAFRYGAGEKAVTDSNQFRTIPAIGDSMVDGCLNVTIGYEENEINDLFVLEEYRRMGYARKLLAMASKEMCPTA